MERLRSQLKVDKWFVAGGSWSATIAYAETHPSNLKGLLLNSIFLARQRDVEWAFTKNDDIERIFPDLWEKRLGFLKKYDVTPSDAAEVLLEKIKSGTSNTVKEIVAGVNNWEVQKRLSNVRTVILPTSNHKFTAEGEIAKRFIFNSFLNKQQ